jgi:hypothetical protein
MLSLYINANTMRLKHRFQGISDLSPDSLLDREAFRKQTNQAGQFGDSNNMFVRDIRNVSASEKRKRVMFAECEELYGSFDHLADAAVWPSMTFRRKNTEQLGISIVALRRIK